MNPSDTIVAISSAVGPAPRMILRLTGPQSLSIAADLTSTAPAHAAALPARIWPGVSGWLYTFVAPRSYTGQDSAEFHIPGSPVLARMLLDEIVRRGARLAEPGEFTARAYLNGRMDLTQAEGVAATIAAHSEREARAARQLLSGELARRLMPLMEEVASILALVEVGIDFSDEDVTFIAPSDVQIRSNAAAASLETLLTQSVRFEHLSREPRVVLVGRPNAGKSTLINALSGFERAIVSAIAGTTRDALSAQIHLARGSITLVDVAGLEALAEPTTVDSSALHYIHQQMRERALHELETADFVILVHAADDQLAEISLPRRADLIVRTKLDLQLAPISQLLTQLSLDSNPSTLPLSAKTGQGMPHLRQTLDTLIFGQVGHGSTLALNSRHVAAIHHARAALNSAADAAHLGPEVIALSLRESLNHLGDVLGQVSPDEVLGRVFSMFCIGK